MPVQPELFPPPIPDSDKTALRSHLYSFGWQTRKQICQALGWTERKVRDVAESLGADIIRGQSGFKLTAQVNSHDPTDLARALQAADAARSQARRMLRYSLNLRRRLHALVG
jgi:hypothetical protein